MVAFICSKKVDIGDDHGAGVLSNYLSSCYMPRVGQALLHDTFYANFEQVGTW